MKRKLKEGSHNEPVVNEPVNCLTCRALDAKDHELFEAKEAIAHLSQGKPLGELIGKQIIINQQRKISYLKAELDKAHEERAAEIKARKKGIFILDTTTNAV